MSLLRFDGAGFDLTANADAPLAEWASELMALPYRDEGRAPDAVDCMGVVEFVQARMGRALRSYAELYRGAALSGLDALIRDEAQAWAPGTGAVGDVLIVGHRGLAHHVAVLCGAGHALHAQPRQGVSLVPIEGKRAAKRFAGAVIYGVARPA